MIVEIGHFALVLALAAALAQTIVPALGRALGDRDLMAVGRSAALTQFACVAIAFAALVNAHLFPTSPSSTSPRTRTARRRGSTSSPASGGTTKARCSSGC